MRFCKDCKHILKPAGALYMPHPESICFASQVLDPVTGESRHLLCKDQNKDADCSLFKEVRFLKEEN